MRKTGLTDGLRSPLIHNFSRLGHPQRVDFGVGTNRTGVTPTSVAGGRTVGGRGKSAVLILEKPWNAPL
jgi:hypothetical protein